MSKTLFIIIVLGLVSFLWIELNPSPYISTIVAPHHDLVAGYREEMFKDIAARQDIDRFILLSPDHYNIEEGKILVYPDSFSTRFGEVNVDSDLVESVLNLGGEIGAATFESEHGVKTILPDLARHFPESEIVPITVKHDIDLEGLDDFIEDLSEGCEDCVLIASVDLSHYQPNAISELHDKLSVRSLVNQDPDLAINLSEVGAPHILRAAIKWSGLRDTNRFQTRFKTNSTMISGDLFEEGTTHIGGWYEAGERSEAPVSVTFTYAGDILLDRGVENVINKLGPASLLDRLGDRVLWGTDIVMANLEGPLTTEATLPVGANNAPRFSFDPSTVSQLGFLHINALNTKNNHNNDAGPAGALQSEQILKANGIETTQRPIVTKGSEIDVVTFGVDVVGLEELDASKFEPYADDDAYRIVVYAHWGPEGELVQSSTQERLARGWIDAGADLVVGTGPHVIQGAEVYNNRPIIYSLGNFIFDMQRDHNTSHGLIVAGEFNGDGVELVVSIIDSTSIRPVLGRAQTYDNEILRLLSGIEEFTTQSEGGVIFTIAR